MARHERGFVSLARVKPETFGDVVPAAAREASSSVERDASAALPQFSAQPRASIGEIHNLGSVEEERQRSVQDLDSVGEEPVERFVKRGNGGEHPEHAEHLRSTHRVIHDALHRAELVLQVGRHERQHGLAATRPVRVQEGYPPVGIGDGTRHAEFVGEHAYRLVLLRRRRVMQRRRAPDVHRANAPR